ncbi:CotH kinase family protein [Candidatus Latescibacterota bacterium]
MAYINGVEIARSNMEGEPGTIPVPIKLAAASRAMTIYNGGDPEVFGIDNISSVLQKGENILAVEVHNNAGYFSDLSVIPFLTLGMKVIPSEPAGVPKNLAFSIPVISFHTNFKIKSEGETLVLTSATGVLSDSLNTGAIPEDASLGRKPDGIDKMVFFSVPTPRESNTSQAITGDGYAVTVSNPGGFYDNNVTVEFSTASDIAVIRYTLDGSVPTESSIEYSSPISVNSTTVVRARTFEVGLFPGPVCTNTYLINEAIELPIISMSTNPENLWDDNIGIYVKGNSSALGGYADAPKGPAANWFEDWERPIHIEFYEPDGTQGFSIDAGVKIVGKGNRNGAQKALAFFARPKYGYEEIDYQIFPNLPITKFKSIVLRTAGSDKNATFFRDALHQRIMQPLDLEVQGYRPSVLFINGEYWGIHNIREKLNEDYLAAQHGVDPDRVDILDDYHARFVKSGKLNAYDGSDSWTCYVIEGTTDHYHELLRYMLDNDESEPEVYEYLKTQIDIENYIDYMAARIFISDPDGPGHNTKLWRPQTENGKWRWLMYDTEIGSGWQQNPFGIPGPAFLADLTNYYIKDYQASRSPDANFFMYSLLENDEFKATFVNRYSDHLNTIFSAEQVIPQVEKIAADIESEIPRQMVRWDYRISSMYSWYGHVDTVKEFFRLRPEYTRKNVANNLGLSGTADVTLDISLPSAGEIRISSLVINLFPWTGTYFKDVPVKLTAIPSPGFAFTGWTGPVVSSSASISVMLSETITMTANFVEDTGATNTVVLNEINYNSLTEFDPGDWIELYNSIEVPVDLSGWVFKDETDANEFIIPDGTIIPAKGYFVLSKDEVKFSAAFPSVKKLVGDFRFGLNNAGEHITLFNTLGEIVDSLTYGDNDPWPNNTDGGGSTLSLISPDLDNAVAESWVASVPKGTPGIGNDQILSVDEVDERNSPVAFALGQNYPNPFNPVTTIPFSVAESGRVTIEIYSITGQLIAVIVDDLFAPGTYHAIFTSNNIANGMYFYQIKAKGFTQTRKMVLVK